jgi:hypothetical protein
VFGDAHASRDRHQVASNVPGRATGGSSRTVGSVNAWEEAAAGRRGVMVTVTVGS